MAAGETDTLPPIPADPMLARLVRELPEGAFLYEPKWDGFRCLALRAGARVELRSRRDRPLARYFPEVVEALRGGPSPEEVLQRLEGGDDPFREAVAPARTPARFPSPSAGEPRREEVGDMEERPPTDPEERDPTVEADRASPTEPGPGDSEGAPPADDEPIREGEPAEEEDGEDEEEAD